MPESDLLRSLDPKLRQQNLQRIVSGLITSESEYRPLLLVIDDIQWIDEASLALLNYLLTHAKSGPLLICVAYRPKEPINLTVAQPSTTQPPSDAQRHHPTTEQRAAPPCKHVCLATPPFP